jgi:hypothetical protein
MGFAFTFKNPWAISKHAKDKMIITFLKPEEFTSFGNNSINRQDLVYTIELPMQMDVN